MQSPNHKLLLFQKFTWKAVVITQNSFFHKQYYPVSSVPGLIPESLCNTCAVKHCSSRLPDYQSLKGLQRSSSWIKTWTHTKGGRRKVTCLGFTLNLILYEIITHYEKHFEFLEEICNIDIHFHFSPLLSSLYHSAINCLKWKRKGQCIPQQI